MITCIVYDSVAEELERLRRILRMEAAVLTADEWNLEFFGRLERLRDSLEKEADPDIICLDITVRGMLGFLRKIRESYANTRLMLIADAGISPMEYLRPSIRPDALLLRPADGPKIQAVLRELLQEYMEQVYQTGLSGSYTVETREGKTILAYSKIIYFESRSKKIYVRAGRQEYGFYETMEHLLEVLPEEFIRCHRSFIVNRAMVKKVLLSQNLIELENGEQIPISRSYRTEVKSL